MHGLMVLLFLLGALLLIIELSVPGFGVAGIVGVISLIGGIVVASQILPPTILIFIIIIIALFIICALYWLYKSATKGGRVSKLLLLRTSTAKEEGYSSVNTYDNLIGKTGKAITKLRPTGTAEINGEKYDVITDGEFISDGSPIKVVKVEGFRIIVEEV